MLKRKFTLWLRSAAVLGILLFFNVGCGSSDWQKIKTDHIILYFKPRSYAHWHLHEAADLYDSLYMEAKNFVPALKTYPILNVYLHDNLRSWGYAQPDTNSVHNIYSRDRKLESMHEMLHVLLNGYNSQVPVMFEEGLCRSTESRSIPHNGQRLVFNLYELAPWPLRGDWSGEMFFEDSYDGDEEGNLAAAFVYFCLQKLGKDRFWKFYKELNKKNGAELIQRTFNQSMDQINRDFAEFMGKIKQNAPQFR